MPRGRISQSNEKAEKVTFIRLVNALAEHPYGLRFTDWLTVSGVHRDTLSRWIPKLIESDIVEKVDHIYRLTKIIGIKWFKKGRLLRNIDDSRNFCVVGGEWSGSLNPADNVRLKSTIGYAFPTTGLDFLEIKNQIHKRFMAYWLYRMANFFEIDPRYLIDELPKDELIKVLQEKLPTGTQVLAFSIDFDKIRELINVNYISDILNFLKEADYADKIHRLALEKKALVFLENRKSPCKLPEIAENLKIDQKEVEQILDSLLVNYSGPKQMDIYNQEAEHLKTVELGPQKLQIKNSNGSKVTIKIGKAKGYLKKVIAEEHIFYQLIADEP